MSNGMSRRDLIKASAIAGAAAWTAPVLLSSRASAQTVEVCSGVKIPSCSSVNGGTVAHCNSFQTDNDPQFQSCVSPLCDTYSPSVGFLFKICGAAVSNLSAIAVTYASNAKCAAPYDQAGCTEADGPFADAHLLLLPFSGCPSAPISGNVIELSPINGSLTNPNFNNGDPLPPAGAGNRYLYTNPPANNTQIGLIICFPVGSKGPTCSSC
jgi:hypothetical protein